jgi:hypothetical protein
MILQKGMTLYQIVDQLTPREFLKIQPWIISSSNIDTTPKLEIAQYPNSGHKAGLPSK